MVKDTERPQNGDTTEPIPREPTQEEFRAFYDSTLETLKDLGLQPKPYKDAQEDQSEPAETYHVTLDDLDAHKAEVSEEDAQLKSVFKVPSEVASQNPRDYYLTVSTPYRLEGNPTDDPKQVDIHAGYVFGDHTASAGFSVWGTDRPDGSKVWQGAYAQEAGEVEYEQEEIYRPMTIHDLRVLGAIVAYSVRGMDGLK